MIDLEESGNAPQEEADRKEAKDMGKLPQKTNANDVLDREESDSVNLPKVDIQPMEINAQS